MDQNKIKVALIGVMVMIGAMIVASFSAWVFEKVESNKYQSVHAYADENGVDIQDAETVKALAESELLLAEARVKDAEASDKALDVFVGAVATAIFLGFGGTLFIAAAFVAQMFFRKR